jgi:hypothetical protein
MEETEKFMKAEKNRKPSAKELIQRLQMTKEDYYYRLFMP